MIDNKIVEYVANLARIELKADELKRLAGELSHILDFIDKLKGVDVDNVSPTSHAISVENVLRDDLPEGSLPVEKAITNAPLKKKNLFLVPRVIE